MKRTATFVRRALAAFPAAAVLILFLAASGCKTSPKQAPLTVATQQDKTLDPTVTLREGDSIKINFPSALSLSTQQVIRRDGRIAIPGLGDINAAGLTPDLLEKAILEKYGSQLKTKEVTVTLESSSYFVFVNGAVMKPGKIEAHRPLTAFEAVMEAGGFDYTRANLKNVRVIRTEGSESRTFELDFRGILKGKKMEPFYLKPSDVIYVSERFNLF
jgi:polysaccharide export outer membrane protein